MYTSFGFDPGEIHLIEVKFTERETRREHEQLSGG